MPSSLGPQAKHKTDPLGVWSYWQNYYIYRFLDINLVINTARSRYFLQLCENLLKSIHIDMACGYGYGYRFFSGDMPEIAT